MKGAISGTLARARTTRDPLTTEALISRVDSHTWYMMPRDITIRAGICSVHKTTIADLDLSLPVYPRREEQGSYTTDNTRYIRSDVRRGEPGIPNRDVSGQSQQKLSCL